MQFWVSGPCHSQSKIANHHIHKNGAGATTGNGNLAQSFESAEQPYPTADPSIVSVQHHLGETPTGWRVVLRNKIPEHGYQIGDEIDITANDDGHGDNGNRTAWVNTSSMGIRIKHAGGVWLGANNGSDYFQPTPARWNIVFRASGRWRDL